MVLVHDTSSQCVLQMYEVETSVTVIKLKSGHDFVTDRQTHRQTDTQTDRQTQGEKQYVSRPLQGGDIINTNIVKYES